MCQMFELLKIQVNWPVPKVRGRAEWVTPLPPHPLLSCSLPGEKPRQPVRNPVSHIGGETPSPLKEIEHIRPDITVMVDWALEINYLSIYLSI